MLLQFIHSFKIHFQFSFIYKASTQQGTLFGKKSQQALCDSGKKKLFLTGRSLQ